MRKFLLTSFLIAAFAFYVWHANAPTTPAGVPVSVIAPDKRSTPLPQESAPTAAAPAPVPAAAPAAAPVESAPPPAPVVRQSPQGMYKDGSYRGSVADAYYGYVQVAALVRGGRLTDVQVLQHPGDRRESIYINSIAMPALVQEAVQAQSAKIDIVSGATDSSLAFRESLTAALDQARY